MQQVLPYGDTAHSWVCRRATCKGGRGGHKQMQPGQQVCSEAYCCSCFAQVLGACWTPCLGTQVPRDGGSGGVTPAGLADIYRVVAWGPSACPFPLRCRKPTLHALGTPTCACDVSSPCSLACVCPRLYSQASSLVTGLCWHHMGSGLCWVWDAAAEPGMDTAIRV